MAWVIELFFFFSLVIQHLQCGPRTEVLVVHYYSFEWKLNMAFAVNCPLSAEIVC